MFANPSCHAIWHWAPRAGNCLMTCHSPLAAAHPWGSGDSNITNEDICNALVNSPSGWSQPPSCCPQVASIMGQWVDLDILHAFYSLDKQKAQLKVYLLELE